MANMTFKANLLPNIDLGQNLGAPDQRWNIYGQLNGANIFYGICETATATAAKTVTCPTFTDDDLTIGTIVFVTISAYYHTTKSSSI